jgi:hypothetical protein
MAGHCSFNVCEEGESRKNATGGCLTLISVADSQIGAIEIMSEDAT